MFNILSESERLNRHLQLSAKAGYRADLTLDQWKTTLEHFCYSCAYCGGIYEIIEHYIPSSRRGGTTVSNCVPACLCCNAAKDNKGVQYMRVYNNRRVVDYLRSRGAKIKIHVHNFDLEKKNKGIVDVFCDCGYKYSMQATPIEVRRYIMSVPETGIVKLI
jgi:hypothetical protein